MELLIRFFGVVGLILCIIPFQFKKHKHIVLLKMTSSLAFATQYFLIGSTAYTGAWMDLISAFRNFLFYKFVDKKIPTLPIILIFLALVFVIGIYSWAGWLTLLALIPKLITTVSYGMKNERLLRLITLPSCVFWIAYNCFVGTYEGAIADFLTFSSIVIAIYRYDIRGSRKAKEEGKISV